MSHPPVGTADPAELAAALISPGFIYDPYPLLDALRDNDPVHWSSSVGGWVLTRYDDILITFKEVETYSNEGRLGRASAYLSEESRRKLGTFEAHYRTKGLLHSDPPEHTRLRRMVLQAFSPRVIEGMRPRIEQIVHDLVDRVEGAGEMDVINDIAFALPVTVLAELMGVPRSDGVRFRAWADGLLGFQGINKPPLPVLLTAQQALVAARSYLADLIDRRRREPGDDLISLMTLESPDGATLSDDEIINTGITLLTAGHETTTSLIGNGLLTLLRHPEQWQELRADPSLLDSAIEEMLRYESPVARQPRLLRQDAELSTRTLHKGDMVFQMLGAANRDPRIFPNPGTFDVHRKPNRHLAFGRGIHFCIGAPLSRAEGEIVFRTLLDRLPRLRLTGGPSGDADWDTAKANSRVLRSLPVRF